MSENNDISEETPKFFNGKIVLPEEVPDRKPESFKIKNAKKFESISEKMKKILESSEKLPQIPTKKVPNLPKELQPPTQATPDFSSLKQAMEGLGDFPDIFKDEHERSEEDTEKMNEHLLQIIEIQSMHLKTLQYLFHEQRDLRTAQQDATKKHISTDWKTLGLSVLFSFLSAVAVILFLDYRMSGSEQRIMEKIELSKPTSTYVVPQQAEPVPEIAPVTGPAPESEPDPVQSTSPER